MRWGISHWAALERHHIVDHLQLPLVHSFQWNWRVWTEKGIMSWGWGCRNAIGRGMIWPFNPSLQVEPMALKHGSVAILARDKHVDGVLQDEHLVR